MTCAFRPPTFRLLVNSYDEEESTDMRRPGMGISVTDRPAFNGFLPHELSKEHDMNTMKKGTE